MASSAALRRSERIERNRRSDQPGISPLQICLYSPPRTATAHRSSPPRRRREAHGTCITEAGRLPHPLRRAPGRHITVFSHFTLSKPSTPDQSITLEFGRLAPVPRDIDKPPGACRPALWAVASPRLLMPPSTQSFMFNHRIARFSCCRLPGEASHEIHFPSLQHLTFLVTISEESVHDLFGCCPALNSLMLNCLTMSRVQEMFANIKYLFESRFLF